MGYRQSRCAIPLSRRLAVLLVVTTAFATGTRAQSSPQVTVSVAEPDGVHRTHAPLTFGVPWPEGVLREPSVSVKEHGGAALPVQTRVLSRWRDGSIRWLLVDTQVTLAPRQSKRLVIARAAPSATAPSKGMHVQERDDRVDVDTGGLRFSIPRTRFAIADRIAAPDRGDTASGPITAVLQRDDAVLAAGPPRQLTVLERGPLRARLQLEGEYGDGFDYVIRVDAYAGQRLLRVMHTFINRDPADAVRVPRITIDWPLGMEPPATYEVGVDNDPPRNGEIPATGVRFVQLDNETWRVDADDKLGTLAGWFTVRGGGRAVGLVARWFWQQYPQSVGLTPAGIAYNLWAPEGGPALVGMGAAKTHELALWSGPAREPLPYAMARPLVAVVDSEWIVRSGALPQAIASDLYTSGFVQGVRNGFDRYVQRNATERWDDRGEVNCDGMFGERPRTGAFGMWNWGDWNFPKYHDQTKGCDAWGNLEYDTAQVLALGFAATGDPRMHEAMVVAARHFMDVDTIHFQRKHPEWVGMNHPKNPLHFSFELGGVDLGHTWSEGLLSYYYLTGDERALAAARGVADYLVRRSKGTLRLANPRQLGWPQVALIAVYDATGDAAYLEAARVFARRATEVFKPEQVPHWKHGILADALAYTHAATRDPAIENWLRTYAHTIRHRPKQAEPRFLPAVAYVARLSADADLRAFVLAGVQHIDFGGWGKPFTLAGRLGFRVYSLLAEPPAVTHATPAPKPARAKAAPRKPRKKK